MFGYRRGYSQNTSGPKQFEPSRSKDMIWKKVSPPTGNSLHRIADSHNCSMQSPADRYLSRHLIDTKGKRRDTMTEGKPKREQEREREREKERVYDEQM